MPFPFPNQAHASLHITLEACYSNPSPIDRGFAAADPTRIGQSNIRAGEFSSAFLGILAPAVRVTYLLTHSSGELSDIARSTTYSRTQVHEVLTGLATAEVVAEKRKGRRRSFRTDVSRWLGLLDLPEAELPVWIEWVRAFAALSTIAGFLNKTASQPSSDYLLSSDVLTLWPKVSSLLDESGLPNPFARTPTIQNAVEAFTDGVSLLTETLAAGS